MKRIALFIITLFVCVICRADTFTQYWYVEDNTPIQTSCTTGGDIILPTPPTKYGYDFIGWEKLPYIPIEYLESTGTQYIDTGFYPNQDTGVKTKIKILSTQPINGPEVAFFGTSINGVNFESYIYGNRLHIEYKYENSYRGPIITNNDVIEIDWNKNKLQYSLNGNLTSHNYTYDNFSVGLSMCLFSKRTRNDTVDCFSRIQLYYFQIYDNDVLVRDFIPVLDKNGTPCMYDMVEGKFYYNAGSGDFIAGPVIGSGE